MSKSEILKSLKGTSTPYALFVFIIPPIIIYTIFWILPVFINLGLSFFKYKGIKPLSEATFIGLGNYVYLIKDRLFWLSLNHNLVYMALTVTVQTVLSLFLAIVIDNWVRVKSFFKLAFFIPYIMSWVVVSFLWKWIYNPVFGLLNSILTEVGLESFIRLWLGDPNIVLYSLIVIAIWRSTGFYTIIFLAGLQAIPQELIEAAQIEGANFWQYIRKITLPLLHPILTIVIVLGLIDGFRVFDVMYIMAEGQPQDSTTVLATYIYQNAFFYFNMGYASAIAVILLLISLFISGNYFKLFAKI